MTREEIIAYAKKKYGQYWIAPLAKDLGYSEQPVRRMSTGEAAVSPRMELAMEKLMRQHRFQALARPDVRYE